MTTPPTQSRPWLRVFFAGFAVIVALLALTLSTRPFQGDLTRIGLLSEDDFGWRAPQPVVDAALLGSVTLAEADVVVLGDSFSKPLVWQAELVRAGLKVKTIDWTAFGSLCQDFGAWLREHGFRGRHVVVQSVERELAGRLATAATCRRTPATSWRDVPQRVPAPVTVLPERRWNLDERLTTGVMIRFNGWRANRTAAEQVFGDRGASERTRLVRVAEGCRWFSHHACDKLLLLARDTRPAPLGAEAIAQIESFNAAQPDVDWVWLVVPNKTTVYLGGPTGFWGELERRKLGPDLGARLAEARERMVDLYAPNDTHLSTSGFGLLGKLALQAVQKVRSP